VKREPYLEGEVIAMKTFSVVRFSLFIRALSNACNLSSRNASPERTAHVPDVSSSSAKAVQKQEMTAELFPVLKGEKFGYVNRTEKLVISPQFDGAATFTEERALVALGRGAERKYGFIDKAGKICDRSSIRACGKFFRRSGSDTKRQEIRLC
jgi:WG repeat protein